MPATDESGGDRRRERFELRIHSQEERKIRAKKRGTSGVWFGFAAFGIVGWTVALPTVLGAILGIWLDRRYPEGRSWTLALLVAGLMLGCFQAWRWISQQEDAIHKEEG